MAKTIEQLKSLKNTDKKKPLSVALDKDVLDQIQKLCKEACLNTSKVVNFCLKQYFKGEKYEK